MTNHLWQSTLFAIVAWLLTLAFRNNRAQVRHWLWLAASVKFLLPFSLLVTIGSHLGWRTVPAIAPPQFSFVMGEIATPALVAAIPKTTFNPIPLLLGIWAFGFAAVVFYWLVRWRRIGDAARSASPLNLEMDLPVRSSPGLIEPGVFGIFKPVLLLPEGITGRLTPAQLEAIIAHELCHVRRRDNLAAAIHMLVEAIFWFHPLVWWIGARLVEERERACDEEVLRMGREPQIYAEGILNVCKFYVESPLVCAAGVTGSNLKQRIEAIMTNRIARKLNFAKRLMLAAAGIAVVAGPIGIGIVNAPGVRAQSQPATPLAFEVASVKLNKSDRQRGMEFLPGGRLTATNIPLQHIIATAYNLPPFDSARLSGGPDWIRSERYDIQATAEKGAIPTGMPVKVRNEKMRLMLQTLLADRFKLAMRRETKEQPVYALVVGKNGPKLQKAKVEEKDCPEAPGGPDTSCHEFWGGQGRGLHGYAVDMSDLALAVQNWTDRPIVNETGVKGLFQIETKPWLPLRPGPPPAPGAKGEDGSELADLPTLFTVFEQLGLKLESQKAPVEAFVIEHVERPSEN